MKSELSHSSYYFKTSQEFLVTFRKMLCCKSNNIDNQKTILSGWNTFQNDNNNLNNDFINIPIAFNFAVVSCLLNFLLFLYVSDSSCNISFPWNSFNFCRFVILIRHFVRVAISSMSIGVEFWGDNSVSESIVFVKQGLLEEVTRFGSLEESNSRPNMR